ncbi:hypothetical protein MUA68_14580 (plasmid) [Staphylococcus aureus]|nr:hypothetical protein [Staphylococcus aureus]UXV49017.1 hypothetical protein MUA24_14530 [Staphylococcus aureus]UXV54399.1 hypothetical protein MUA78_14385 [Staphylococcus aureus]UXV57111.1 hypothetical protein MUA68_14580 [Staphylococcus aureus]
MLKRSYVVAANQHYVVNLKDDNGVVKITFVAGEVDNEEESDGHSL